MNKINQWKMLESADQLEAIQEESKEKPVVVFKHSTRCSISAMVLNRLERDWNDDEMKPVDFYFLDLLSYRDISSQIAENFGVRHESPQMIIIKDGKAVFHASHMGVTYEELKKNAL